MYNEKNEIKKVNFGDLPVNWDEEEFAEELTVDDQEDRRSLDVNSRASDTERKSNKF
ncbi:pilus assembly protein PilM [Paenibacillus endoradicis]|uniref:pilus assembly protein PilM n=1 Tax=Paenibacillus endoradicis TaxID=2972487 RepID=UPI002158F742|nr:pilus assembly protein PilM [Paenibacillus endoradicis]MCR8659204.1 pilus assembly protein PilM [Paenibacillus endoradicis]